MAQGYIPLMEVAITQPVGIVEGTDNLVAAPFPPDTFPDVSSLTILTADPAALAAGDRAMKERFAELFGG